MRTEASILREWWAYLNERKQSWNRPSDQLLLDWRQHLKAEAASTSRIARKLDVVFQFYLALPQALLLVYPFVGLNGPVTSKTVKARAGGKRTVWSCSKLGGGHNRKRPTPGEADVLQILTRLRSCGTDVLSGERNWLIGRLMSEAGLRRSEAAAFGMTALVAALKREGIKVPVPEDRRKAMSEGWNPALPVLDGLAEWKEGKSILIGAVDRLERSRRKSIYVRVLGKGDKEREVPFPLHLVRDIMEIGIWNVRRSQVQDRRRRDSRYLPPDELFISEKTGKALSDGGIGDLVKDAFKACDVEGSGHRLRAHFATKLAATLWEEMFAKNHFRWDQTVENDVLNRLAEALGHSHVTTTVRSYLDLALVEQLGLPMKSKLPDLRKVMETFANSQRSLTKDQIGIIADVIGRLNDGAKTFEEVLKAALVDERLFPENKKAPEPKTIHSDVPRIAIRLVSDNN